MRVCPIVLTHTVGWQLSSFGKLKVSGKGSLELLQRALTAEMDKSLGAVTYSLFCNTQGGVQGVLAFDCTCTMPVGHCH